MTLDINKFAGNQTKKLLNKLAQAQKKKLFCFDVHHIGISLPYRPHFIQTLGRKMWDRLLWFGHRTDVTLDFILNLRVSVCNNNGIHQFVRKSRLLRRWFDAESLIYIAVARHSHLRMRNVARRRLIAFFTLSTVVLRNTLSFVWAPVFRLGISVISAYSFRFLAII